jgi:hypothetical protein
MNPKMILILLFSLFSSLLFSQTGTNADTVYYGYMINKQICELRNGAYIKVYCAVDKNYYKVGDTLILGTATGQQQSAFNHKLNFDYVFYGKPAGIFLKGIRYVEDTYQGYKITIESVRFSKGGFGLENYVFFSCKPLSGIKFSVIDEYITVTMADNAIRRGEIVPFTRTRPMTRSEAITYLKSKKEELDLELITQEEYDSIREQLLPIIKQ